MRDGHPATAATSDRRAARYDGVQYDHPQGPGLAATRSGEIILISDLVADDRFGEYRSRALALGVRCVLSLPLVGGDRVVGALNLYSRRTRAFGPRARAEAKRLADEASRALTLAMRLAADLELTDQLRGALTFQAVIDRAIGIIMGQNFCSAAIAAAVLRAAARDRNLTPGAVAAQIVATLGDESPTGTRRRQPGGGRVRTGRPSWRTVRRRACRR